MNFCFCVLKAKTLTKKVKGNIELVLKSYFNILYPLNSFIIKIRKFHLYSRYYSYRIYSYVINQIKILKLVFIAIQIKNVSVLNLQDGANFFPLLESNSQMPVKILDKDKMEIA